MQAKTEHITAPYYPRARLLGTIGLIGAASL